MFQRISTCWSRRYVYPFTSAVVETLIACVRPLPSESISRETERTRTPSSDLFSSSPESTDSADTTRPLVFFSQHGSMRALLPALWCHKRLVGWPGVDDMVTVLGWHSKKMWIRCEMRATGGENGKRSAARHNPHNYDRRLAQPLPNHKGPTGNPSGPTRHTIALSYLQFSSSDLLYSSDHLLISVRCRRIKNEKCYWSNGLKWGVHRSQPESEFMSSRLCMYVICPKCLSLEVFPLLAKQDSWRLIDNLSNTGVSSSAWE